jgi:predicted LPLAT superfamily acyltransferase
MNFHPCLIVPVYDPGPALARTVAALADSGLPTYLVDDGSDLATRRELQRLASDQPRIQLLTLCPNQGKGAAVMTALRRAGQDGYSHALQVDADGQHDLGAVTTFLALGQAQPGAVIAGVPSYDRSVPMARKYWRYLSHACVWLNTLSLDIRDSLCGFRLYPLGPTLELMAREAIPRRMSFDTEIIVRLHWAGVPVVNAPVAVTYPRDGVSHFRPLRDSFLLMAMHTRLFLGMLRRAPGLWRARRRRKSPWYRVKERGTRLGYRCLTGILRLLGPRGLRLAGECMVPYFFLTSRQARRASLDYLRRIRALGALRQEPGVREVYHHFRCFGRATADKVLAWSGCSSGIQVEGAELEAFLRRPGARGSMILGAHLGNMEMLRALGQERGLPGLNAVVYGQNALRFHEFLGRLNPGFQVNLVQVAAVSPDTAILLEEKLDRGESLFIVGDRTPPSDRGRTVPAPFLGDPAPFPIGPFLLAHLLRCPVHLLFCVHDGQRYQVRLVPFAERIEWPRAGRDRAIADWAARYAQCLEAQCRDHPFQWFNFFDFWATR